MSDIELLRNHEKSPIKSLYFEYLVVIRNLLVALDASSNLLSIQEPESPDSLNYIHAARDIQSYFINVGSTKELLGKTKGCRNFKFSSEQQSLYLIGKAIRNRVAHEGVWPPMFRNEYTRAEGHVFSGFVYRTEEILILLSGLLAGRNYSQDEKGLRKQNREMNQLNEARTYLNEVGVKGFLRLNEFITHHKSKVVSELIASVENSINTKEFRAFSEIRVGLELSTIENQISLAKTFY